MFEIISLTCPGCGNRTKATRRGSRREDGFIWIQLDSHDWRKGSPCSRSGNTIYPSNYERGVLGMSVLAEDAGNQPEKVGLTPGLHRHE